MKDVTKKFLRTGAIMKMINFLRKLFCGHDYVFIERVKRYDYLYEDQYKVDVYVCSKCGKKMEKMEL